MRIPLDRMVDGLVQALTKQVAPHVGDRYARGQLWSVVDVLANLRDRIDWNPTALEDETRSAVDALEQIAAVLRDAGLSAAADALPRVPTDGAPAERVQAARAALVAAIEVVAGAPADVAARAQGPLGAHLAGNAFRDMQTFKPSLLSEISKG